MDLSGSTYYSYRTPFGAVTVGVCAGAVTHVALGETTLPGERRPSPLSNRCANELLEYFVGKRTAFNVALAPEGTAFQRAVWRAVANVPYGQTRSCAEIARSIGRPESFRMVGTAVRKNPIAVIIPAHRVVGANGRPTGAGKNAQLRAAFLELERRNS
ncbi:MAG: methylated-DNA--[protein]-cysteine S-methyltransferase [Eggerthellaceae bacterium]|nr:methylated-DNA--[protein]-cysteine S-methyltransferase [Eggerthellaceae bacterium]